MKVCYFTLLLMCCIHALAQQPDQALIRVKYDFSHMRDTTDQQNYYKETMLLIAGKNASVFLSYDKIQKDVQAKNAIEEQIKQQAGVEKPTYKMPQRTRAYLETELYYYANEAKFFTKEPMGITYLVEDNADKIQWKIGKDTTTIEGIKCKKATADFKGRNWIAWYAEDIPLPSGPWKLNGLPGLIVKANDDKNEVIFDFAGLERIDEAKDAALAATLNKGELKNWGGVQFLTAKVINLPSNAVKATPKEMARLKEAREKDPQGFARTQMAAMGFGSMKPVSVAPTNPYLENIKKQQAKFNNPIEKKDQQL